MESSFNPEESFGGVIPSAPLLPHNGVVVTPTDSRLLRKLYFWASGHLTILAAFTALLVYIPHLRKILRKDIFDRLLLTSIIGVPLLLAMVAFAYFPSMRKRFAFMALTIIVSIFDLNVLLMFNSTTEPDTGLALIVCDLC